MIKGPLQERLKAISLENSGSFINGRNIANLLLISSLFRAEKVPAGKVYFPKVWIF